MEPHFTIGLDARLSGRRHAGLGRYIKNLALRLPFILPANFRLVYFFADKTQWSELIADLPTLQLDSTLPAAQILQRVKIVIAPIRHYSLAEQLELPSIFRQENLDLLHVPHFNLPYFAREKKVILTIHDLLWHEKKGLQMTTLKPWQYHLKYFAYRLLTGRVIKRANYLLAPSQTIKKTILQFYPRVAAKIHVIYNGVTDFHSLTAPAKFPQTLPANFLLYVGSLYPHKNVELILQALKKTPSLQLVIVSTRDAFYSQLQKRALALGVASQVTFLGRVSDAQLKYLYQTCSALVQPSISEGFGLTGIEALKLGRKVLASDIPVFREVYGAAFFPFDPHDVDSFLAALTNSQTADLAAWQKLAQAQAAQYDWTQMTKKVAALYQKVLHE